MQELAANGVEIYSFPTDDESVAEVNGSMNSHIPFAVVGSTDMVKIGNKTVRARQYPWGTVQGKRPSIWPLSYLLNNSLGLGWKRKRRRRSYRLTFDFNNA